MNKRIYVLCGFLLLSLVLPASLHAQDSGLSDDLSGLELTLSNVYNAMIAKCSWLITVASGIGGLAAVFYVGNKVWGSIARAEPIDFYPLLRPFCLGMCISLFPAVIATFNGILQPTVSGTAAIVTDSKEAVATLLQRKEDALQQSSDWQMYVGPDGSGDIAKWEQLSGEADDGFMSGISNRVKFEMSKMAYNFKNSIKVWLSELLQVLYEAAALCINTVRTFYLIILAILGPLVFAISIFDGLHHILVSWIARYINVFLWLPIANIFSSLVNQIQQEMIKLDIQQIQASGETTFGSTDAAYLVFLLMAIVGYFTVPTIANHIIHPGSAGAHLQKMTNVVGQTGQAAVEAAGTMATLL